VRERWCLGNSDRIFKTHAIEVAAGVNPKGWTLPHGRGSESMPMATRLPPSLPRGTVLAAMIRCSVLAFLLALTAFAADITGKWTASFETQIGTQNYTYEFKVDGGKITGTVKSNLAQGKITEGTLKGDDITFVEMLDFQGQELRIDYKGKVSGDEMKLTRQVGDVASEELVAKRAK